MVLSSISPILPTRRLRHKEVKYTALGYIETWMPNDRLSKRRENDAAVLRDTETEKWHCMTEPGLG